MTVDTTAIKAKLSELKTPTEFAHAINDLGFELMDSGQTDSDELVWEAARDLWKSFEPGFEAQVSAEFHKILDQT